MTAITSPQRIASARVPGPLERIWRVVRLHFANPWPVAITPWLILGIIFLANVVIWWIVSRVASGQDAAGAAEGLSYSGASFYIFVYMLVVAVMAMNQSFAYALGFSSTRRDYYLGTAVTFVLLSAMYTAGFTILGVIERATDGWGLNGRMFSAVYFGESWIQTAVIVFSAFLFFFFLGSFAGGVFVRWHMTGLITFFAVIALVLIGGAALFTVTKSWTAFGTFFVNAGLVGSFLWSLVLTVAFAISGFFILRRATPRG